MDSYMKARAACVQAFKDEGYEQENEDGSTFEQDLIKQLDKHFKPLFVASIHVAEKKVVKKRTANSYARFNKALKLEKDALGAEEFSEKFGTTKYADIWNNSSLDEIQAIFAKYPDIDPMSQKEINSFNAKRAQKAE